MNKYWALSLLIATQATTVQAEVFKCTAEDGATHYQSKPCETFGKEQQLDIHSDPEQEAAAKEKLKKLEAELEAKKTAKAEAEKKAKEEKERNKLNELQQRLDQERLELQRRERQAVTQERRYRQEAERLENAPYVPYVPIQRP